MPILRRDRSLSRTATLAAALALALSVAAPPASAEAGSPLQKALDGVVAAGAPGAVAEFQGERGVWRGASGVADVRSPRPPDPRSHWRIASITKTFTATVTLQLAGEGRIGLDDPVGRYLPGLLPDGDRITVRMLLQHTAGTYNYVADLLGTPQQVRDTYRTTYRPADLVGIANAHGPAFPPGERWAYDNTGYIVLGMLIEKVTGRPADRVVTDRIVRPLGLAHTRFPVTGTRLPRPRLHGYFPDERGRPEDITAANPSSGWTTGAMISNAADLNAFLRALLGGRLLPPRLLAEMRRTVRAEDATRGYGLGLRRNELPCGRTVWGNIGIAFGYTTYAFQDGRRALTVVGSLAGPPDWSRLEPALSRVLTTAFC
ncbi:serine hydrolase domain-containing protein [Actinomadura yumaensis]|uniref:Serine hydrolase domain-containing protein n=1 Tax=Actinomadura yumaensis TaxID=111807 RepID=A0ABW2D3A6_9ACTN